MASQAILSKTEYVTNLVRQRDREGYLCSLFLPAAARAQVLAVRALNVELAMIRDSVSNPSIGHLRFAWWKESITQLFKDFDAISKAPDTEANLGNVWEWNEKLKDTTSAPSCGHAHTADEPCSGHTHVPSHGASMASSDLMSSVAATAANAKANLNFSSDRWPTHPVLQALGDTLPFKRANPRWLTKLIDERKSRLEEHPFLNTKAVEAYAEGTVSSILYLTMEALGIQSLHADHAASHVGKALGIITHLRAVPYNLQNRRVFLPLDLLAKEKLSQEQIFRGENNDGFRNVVHELASSAYTHIATARSMAKDLPLHANKALLPAIPASQWLKALEKHDFDLRHKDLHTSRFTLPLSLLQATVQRKF